MQVKPKIQKKYLKRASGFKELYSKIGCDSGYAIWNLYEEIMGLTIKQGWIWKH